MAAPIVFLPEVVLIAAALASTILGFLVGRRTQILWGWALGALIVAMVLTPAATDLFVLYLAFELSSISTFALVAFRKKDRQSTEASLKFFIIGAVSSAIILFGISIVYGVAGSPSIAAPGEALTDLALLRDGLTLTDPRVLAMEPPLLVAIVFLIAGFGFKVAVVPFHMWAPDVYQGAPTTISTFLAAGSKK